MKKYLLLFFVLVNALCLVSVKDSRAQDEDVILDVSDDLEPLEAEKFDDEVQDADFEDIDDSEFQDIDGLGGEVGADEVPPEVMLDESDETVISDPGLGEEEGVVGGGEEAPVIEDTIPQDPLFGDGGDSASDPVLGDTPEDSFPQDVADDPIAAEPVTTPPQMAEPAIGGGPVVSDSILNDEPDSGFESRLHNIFEQYYKTPISNEDWAQIAGDKQKEIYSVVQGDSLWEISEVFFGDGNYWPKVWSFNASITNPHVIEIGDRIAFYPGDEENPPKVVVEQKSEPVQAELPPEELTEEEVAYEDELLTEEEYYGESGEVLDIPAPTNRFLPVLKSIPPSLPGEKPKFYEGFDSSGFAVSDRRFSRGEVAEMRLTSFIAETAPESIGEVTELSSGRGVAQLYEPIYVQMKSGSPGDIVTAYEIKEKGEDDKELVYKEGTIIEYQGEIELQDVVNADLNLFRGLVVSLVNSVGPGAKITAGTIPKINVSNTGEAISTQANLVGGEYNSDRKALGVGSVVYLDAGSDEGIQPESIVGVVANEKLRNEDTKIAKNTREIGRVKIAKVEKNLSTGIVVYASGEISKGDFVGQTQVSGVGRGSEIEVDAGDDLDFGGDLGEGDIEDDLNDAFEEEGDFSDEALEEDGFSDEDFGDEFSDGELGLEDDDKPAGGDDLGGQEFSEADFGDDDFASGESSGGDEFSDEDFGEDDLGGDDSSGGGLEDDLNDELDDGADFSDEDFGDQGLGGDDFGDDELTL